MKIKMRGEATSVFDKTCKNISLHSFADINTEMCAILRCLNGCHALKKRDYLICYQNFMLCWYPGYQKFVYTVLTVYNTIFFTGDYELMVSRCTTRKFFKNLHSKPIFWASSSNFIVCQFRSITPPYLVIVKVEHFFKLL